MELKLKVLDDKLLRAQISEEEKLKEQIEKEKSSYKTDFTRLKQYATKLYDDVTNYMTSPNI